MQSRVGIIALAMAYVGRVKRFRSGIGMPNSCEHEAFYSHALTPSGCGLTHLLWWVLTQANIVQIGHVKRFGRFDI